MRALVIAATLLFVGPALAEGFPPPVAFSTYPVVGVESVRYGELEFPSREKKEVLKGRIWRGDVIYSARATDPRRALAVLIDDLVKAGWEVMLRDEPGNPPLASLKYSKDGKDWWALISVFDRAKVTVLEVGPPK